MLDPPQVTHTADQHTAVVRLTIPREEMRNLMGPGIRELMAAVAAQGIAPAGPWFTHHLRMDPATFDFEIGVPVATPIAAAGRVQPGRLAAATVARTVYHGPYLAHRAQPAADSMTTFNHPFDGRTASCRSRRPRRSAS